MRKNRANSGYVGKIPVSPSYSGVITTSKMHLDKDESEIIDERNEIIDYIRPSNGNGYGASAFASLKNGVLSTIGMISFGGGYTSEPVVSISGGGSNSPIYANTSRTSGRITSIQPWYSVQEVIVTDGGEGYVSTPTVGFSTPSNGASNFTAFITGITLEVTARASGVLFPGQLIRGTTHGVTSGTIIVGYGSGTGSTGTYTININHTIGTVTMLGTSTPVGTATISNGRVVSVGITYSGTKYVASAFPTVSFSGGSPRVSANAQALMVTGTGYTQAPIVTITPEPSIPYSGGTFGAAIAYATIANAELDQISISSGGQNYTSKPTVFVGDRYYDRLGLRSSISGGSVTGVTFNAGFNIFSSPPTVTIGGWKPLPSITAGDQIFAGTFAIYNHNSNFVSFICGASYSVDWGDGTTENFRGGTFAIKQYDQSVYAGLTLQDEFQGYKTVNIIVTPQPGFTLSNINLNRRHPLLSHTYNTPWLDIALAGPGITGMELASSNGGTVNILMNTLEQFKFIGSHSLTTSTGLAYLFYRLRNLRSITPPNFSTITATVFNMFNGCNNLLKIDSLDFTSNNSSLNTMFSGCSNLREIKELIFPSISNYTALGMFTNCYNLRRLPKILNTEKCTSFATMFSGCMNLVRVPQLNTVNSTTHGDMFASCIKLTEVPPLNLANSTNTQSMFSGCFSLTKAPLFNTSKVTNMNSMFNFCHSLVNAPYMDTSRVTDMGVMFNYCHNLKNVPNYDTRAVTSMSNMFGNCYSLVSIPYLNTANVTNMDNMFTVCTSLITIPKLNTTRVTSMQSTFNGCSSLETIPELDYSSVSNLLSAFTSCIALTRLPKFNFNPATTPLASTALSSTFSGCSSLTEFPEANVFGTTGSAKTTSLGSIFSNCSSIRRIAATGFCHSFSVASTLMGSTQLNELYTNLPVVGASGAGAKTLTITSTWGRTGDDPMIAISKGWAVSG